MSQSKYLPLEVLEARARVGAYIAYTFQPSRDPLTGRGVTHKGRNVPKRVRGRKHPITMVGT